MSTKWVLGDPIESGSAVRKKDKRRFFELADRLAHTVEPEEQRRLKEELALMTFGE